MTLIRVLTIAACALSVFNGHAFAQSRSNVQVPNEFPPASFTGRQYVDSRGCVYIRAGIDGQTSWIPRMSRSRKVLCGFQPSLSPAQAQAAAAAPRTEPAPQVKQITVPHEPRPAQAASGTQTRTAAAQPQTVRRAAPAAPQPQPQPQAVRRSACAKTCHPPAGQRDQDRDRPPDLRRARACAG